MDFWCMFFCTLIFPFRIFWFRQVGSLQHAKVLVRSSRCSKHGRRLDADQIIGADWTACLEHDRELATAEHGRQAVLRKLSNSKASIFMHQARTHDAHRSQPCVLLTAHCPPDHRQGWQWSREMARSRNTTPWCLARRDLGKAQATLCQATRSCIWLR